jgi:hypothetical protein
MENRYAPPKSPVADVVPANTKAQFDTAALSSPPQLVKIATWLLWLSMAIGICKGLYVVAARPHNAGVLAVVVVVMGVTLGLYIGLILAIRRGRNWARILFLLVVLVGFLMTVLRPGRYFPKDTIGATVWIIQGIIQATAVCFLFLNVFCS